MGVSFADLKEGTIEQFLREFFEADLEVRFRLRSSRLLTVRRVNIADRVKNGKRRLTGWKCWGLRHVHGRVAHVLASTLRKIPGFAFDGRRAF